MTPSFVRKSEPFASSSVTAPSFEPSIATTSSTWISLKPASLVPQPPPLRAAESRSTTGRIRSPRMLDFYRDGDDHSTARMAAAALRPASQKVAIDGHASEGTSFRHDVRGSRRSDAAPAVRDSAVGLSRPRGLRAGARSRAGRPGEDGALAGSLGLEQGRMAFGERPGDLARGARRTPHDGGEEGNPRDSE